MKKLVYVLGLLALILGLFFSYKYYSKLKLYNKAMTYYNSGNRIRACYLFRTLGDFKKSKQMIDECKVYYGKWGYEPVEWIVLAEDEKNNTALLYSKKIIDCKCYNDDGKGCTWQSSTLRTWLNDVFYNGAFTLEERDKILITNIVNNDNKEYGTKGGDITDDRIFCLSIDEANAYFKNNDERIASGTTYAKGVKNNGYTLNIAENGNSCYWLRSPGGYQYGAAGISEEGYIYNLGYGVADPHVGVRPAFWIKY